MKNLEETLQLITELHENISNMERGKNMYQAVSLKEKYNEAIEKLSFLKVEVDRIANNE